VSTEIDLLIFGHVALDVVHAELDQLRTVHCGPDLDMQRPTPLI
jgi:hypothetical protein